MKTILIVDQVASRRELLRTWLQDDYTVYPAADAAAGIALAAQMEPDLIFLAPALPDSTMAAAKDMSDADRNAMIHTMVERLATRLKQNGDDVEGWLRLVRAYMVLGERDKAKNALTDARQAVGPVLVQVIGQEGCTVQQRSIGARDRAAERWRL